MPSWNIHIAQVESLMKDPQWPHLGICDPNAFLMGNLAPDIYVGYMVGGISHKIDYRQTHLTNDEHVPLAGEKGFYERYVLGAASSSGTESPTQLATRDFILGSWAHLVCDHVFNAHTRARLTELGLRPSDAIRQMKQADFAHYGKSLSISLKPKLTTELIAAAEAFPQYPILESDLQKAVEVASEIVDSNFLSEEEKASSYCLLTQDFFTKAQAEAQNRIIEGLEALHKD